MFYSWFHRSPGILHYPSCLYMVDEYNFIGILDYPDNTTEEGEMIQLWEKVIELMLI